MLILAFAFTAAANFAAPANACPMCRQALDADKADEEDAAASVPQAYMFSILFMLAMPATLFTAFAIFFYRLSKRAPEMALTPGTVAGAAAGAHHLTPHQSGGDARYF